MFAHSALVQNLNKSEQKSFNHYGKICMTKSLCFWAFGQNSMSRTVQEKDTHRKMAPFQIYDQEKGRTFPDAFHTHLLVRSD